MYASGLLWAARDPVATILAYAIAMHEQYVNPHVCRMRTKQLGGWKRRGKTATENSGWRGGQNVHGIILNLFVGHYVGHEEERGRGLDLERVSPRGEFFAYFCAWRERANIFRKEIRIPMFVYTVEEESGCERIEIYRIALLMEIMALFAKIEEEKFDVNICIVRRER